MLIIATVWSEYCSVSISRTRGCRVRILFEARLSVCAGGEALRSGDCPTKKSYQIRDDFNFWTTFLHQGRNLSYKITVLFVSPTSTSESFDRFSRSLI